MQRWILSAKDKEDILDALDLAVDWHANLMPSQKVGSEDRAITFRRLLSFKQLRGKLK